MTRLSRKPQAKAKSWKDEEGRKQRFALLSFLVLTIIAVLALTINADASLTRDQKKVLKTISKQMNAYKTMSGEFIQTGPNGGTAKGVFHLDRPGNIRFQYAPPAEIDIIADGKSVAVINKKLETQDLLPLKKTPLRYLLRRKLNLNKVDGIKNVGLLGNSIVVIIEDAEAFNESQLRLFFNKDTYDLEQWIVTDTQGLDTSVQIFNTKKNASVDQKLFKIRYPGE
ncbi:MAG: outer-membrane lipoprotein carrier protein LolA [Pseudomonadota bacterium]